MTDGRHCSCAQNMFDPKSATDQEYDDIRLDVEEEVGKYGNVKFIFVDKNSQVCVGRSSTALPGASPSAAQGHVYLRVNDNSTAEGVVRALHGRTSLLAHACARLQ